MTYQDLRKKYPKFIYEKFEYGFVNSNLEIKYFYSIPPDHHFTHKLYLSSVPSLRLREGNKRGELDNLVFHLGLSLMPSYWKAACSPVIEVKAGNLSSKQIAFWHKLFIKGMSEYFYKNQIDFTQNDFLTILSTNTTPYPPSSLGGGIKEGGKPSVLIPIGGGKDSIVTLELLKPHFQIIPFVVNPVPIMYEVIKTAGLESPVVITSKIDPYLLELNKQGYLNGHVPVTATHSLESLLAAYLTGASAIAFSNERSSNEGNTSYLGHEINHQYSKTLEFESDLNSYLISLNSNIKCFSFLRPLYELQITKLFSHYSQYFPVFSSCNHNFTIDPKEHPQGLWCGKCPKCVSTSLMLACFIGKVKVTEIMGIYPPDLPENKKILDDLLGNNPIKPFECVLTRAEAQAAYSGQGLDKLLSSWLPNPNMPTMFEKILKDAI